MYVTWCDRWEEQMVGKSGRFYMPWWIKEQEITGCVEYGRQREALWWAEKRVESFLALGGGLWWLVLFIVELSIVRRDTQAASKKPHFPSIFGNMVLFELSDVLKPWQADSKIFRVVLILCKDKLGHEIRFQYGWAGWKLICPKQKRH